MTSKLFSLAVGYDRMPLALEQDLAYFGDQLRQGVNLVQRLEQGEFGFGVAMEAQALVPESQALGAFYTTHPRQRQLALEGVLDSLWDFVVRIFNSIVNFFKSIFGKKSSDSSKIKEAAKAQEEAKNANAEVEKTASQVKVDNLDLFVRTFIEGKGKDGPLAAKLGSASWEVREYLLTGGGNDCFGLVAEHFLTNQSMFTTYLKGELTTRLKRFETILNESARGEEISDDELNHLKGEPLMLDIKGHGKMEINAAREKLAEMWKHARSQGPTSVDFGKLRSGLWSPSRPKLSEVETTHEAMLDEIGNVSEEITRLRKAAEAMRGKGSKGNVPERNANLKKFQDAVMEISYTLHHIGRVSEVTRFYTDMVIHTYHYAGQVLKLVDEALVKENGSLDSTSSSKMQEELDDSKAKHRQMTM